MKRREEWCKQLIESVAQIHECGLVLGLLGCKNNPPLAVSGHDEIMPWTGYSPWLAYQSGDLVGLPPECRPFQDCQKATQKTDLYELDYVLWRLAGYRMGDPRAALCEVFHCLTPRGTMCTQAHIDPIALPMSSEQYPTYLQQIINSCRSEDPANRTSARLLLNLCPPKCEQSSTCDHATTSRYLGYPEEYQRSIQERYIALVANVLPSPSSRVIAIFAGTVPLTCVGLVSWQVSIVLMISITYMRFTRTSRLITATQHPKRTGGGNF